MNTTEIKGLLAAASASAGEPDSNWTADAVDRLYFFDPKNQETSGCVDVQRNPSGPGPARVRLELWVEPSKAAEVIAMVTGATTSVEARLCALVKSGRLPVTTLEPAPKPAPPPLSFGAPKAPTLEERDEARSRELTALISAQAKDSHEDEPEAKPEDEDEEPDGLPPEVLADE